MTRYEKVIFKFAFLEGFMSSSEGCNGEVSKHDPNMSLEEYIEVLSEKAFGKLNKDSRHG